MKNLLTLATIAIIIGAFGLVAAESPREPIVKSTDVNMVAADPQSPTTAPDPSPSAPAEAPTPTQPVDPTDPAPVDAADTGHVSQGPTPATPTEPVYIGGDTYVAAGSNQTATFTMAGN